MKTVRVRLGDRSYSIVIGQTVLGALPEYLPDDVGTDAVTVTNPFLKRAVYPRLAAALEKAGIGSRVMTVPDGERSKSLSRASILLEKLARDSAGKRVFLIALGGGVIGDLAGFCASVVKRGIPLVQVPTTLLAQVDSAIGGKTGLDLKVGKNLVGSFWQPRLVLSDVSLLSSLPLRQVRAGLAEVIKYGLIGDAALFGLLEKRRAQLLSPAPALLEEIVERCSRIKAEVVEKDERDTRGLRTILNFGHTLGHALEAAGRYREFNHGEAVSAGMLLAADLSVELGLLAVRDAARVETLCSQVGLPVSFPRRYIPAVIDACRFDKKFRGTRNRFVLLASPGKTRILEDIPMESVRKVLEARAERGRVYRGAYNVNSSSSSGSRSFLPRRVRHCLR